MEKKMDFVNATLKNGVRVNGNISETLITLKFVLTTSRLVALSELSELWDSDTKNRIITNHLIRKGWIKQDGTTVVVHFKMDVALEGKDKWVFTYYLSQ